MRDIAISTIVPIQPESDAHAVNHRCRSDKATAGPPQPSADRLPVFARALRDNRAVGRDHASSLVETRILSFEQPRYSCDPYNSTTQGWKEELVGRDPQHVPLQPTAKKGCILAETRLVGLDDRALDNLPIYNQTPAQIELRVDGVPRRVPMQ